MSENITNNPSVPTQVVAELKFPRFINNLGIIPTSYKDSMSYYETLAWLCKYLEETVLPTVNQNGKATEELQGLYIQLNDYVSNYFENLDVQEEINNKLDDMVEQGTLQEIIGDYLNSNAVWGFDTVSDMKNSTNLINGSFARTLGYHSKNDGGSATYKIRTITNDDVVDNITIIEMNDNSLIAELIIEDNTISLKQAGGKENDNTFNNSTLINTINNKGYNVLINEGEFYCLSTIEINIEKGKIYGVSTKSSLLQNSTFDGDCLINVFSLNGSYSTRGDRIKTIENLNLIGNEKIINGLKCGGENSTTKEGHVDCIQYNNIKINGFDKGLVFNSHFYKNIFQNVIIDNSNYSIYYNQNATDIGEATNFIGCSLWGGSLYIREECNFIGCTIHYTKINNISSIHQNTYNCFALFDSAQLVNFTDCHFESLIEMTFENVFISYQTQVNINNSVFLVTPANGIVINDSYFKAIQNSSTTSGNISEFIIKDCIMKYLLVRITAGSNFIFAKGNVKIYTNTIFKNDATVINYKMYDSTVNFIEGDTDLKPFIITDGYKDGGSVSVSSNTLTLATPTATSINTYGVMKKYYVGEHKAGHIVINNTICSNTDTTKLVLKFNTDSPNLIQFYNKEGKRINTPNVAGANDKFVSEFNVNRFFNIPSDCEFILFGVGGYGSNYRYPLSFTISDYYLELI